MYHSPNCNTLLSGTGFIGFELRADCIETTIVLEEIRCPRCDFKAKEGKLFEQVDGYIYSAIPETFQ